MPDEGFGGGADAGSNSNDSSFGGGDSGGGDTSSQVDSFSSFSNPGGPGPSTFGGGSGGDSFGGTQPTPGATGIGTPNSSPLSSNKAPGTKAEFGSIGPKSTQQSAAVGIQGALASLNGLNDDQRNTALDNIGNTFGRGALASALSNNSRSFTSVDAGNTSRQASRDMLGNTIAGDQKASINTGVTASQRKGLAARGRSRSPGGRITELR